MDTPNTFLLLLDLFLFTILVIVHAVKLSFPSDSKFELNRRAETGDQTAQQDLMRLGAYDRLQTFRSLIETTLIIIVSVLSVYTLGWLLGVMLALVVIMQRDALARSNWITNLATKRYQHHEWQLINKVSGWGWLDWFRGQYSDKGVSRLSSKAELVEAIRKSPSVLTRDEHARFMAGASFDEKTIKDVMTPKAVVDVAKADDVVGPLVLDELHKTGHSRFPVVDDDIDHVIGVLYLHDLIDAKPGKRTVRAAMNDSVHYVHESQTLEHALHGFLRTRRHLFIVVNDYRETVGVVSLEDVLEALIGKKIIDEFDRFDDLRAVAASNPRKNNSPKGKKDI